jgi:hypothetical protein
LHSSSALRIMLAMVAVPLATSGCSGNPEPRVITVLSTQKPVCLTVDWAGAPPTYSGRPAPDTLLLLPGHDGRSTPADAAESWGAVALSRSQQDREGPGWSWWTVGDTLVIRGWSLTEEDLVLQTANPGLATSATWVSAEMGATRKRGSATLHSYKCSGHSD